MRVAQGHQRLAAPSLQDAPGSLIVLKTEPFLHVLNERLELGRRGFGKVILRDSGKRRDVGFGLASVQEQVRVPFKLIIIIVVVQVRIATGLKGDVLLPSDNVSATARAVASGIRMLVGFRKSAEHREIDIKRK